MKRIVLVASLAVLASGSNAFAAQWLGPNDSTSSIGRKGHVGIGTSAPSQLLHLKESKSGTHPNLRIEDSKGDGIYVGYNTTGNFGALNSSTGGKDYWDMLTWKEGRVGIGGAPSEIKYTNGAIIKPLVTIHGDLRLEKVPVWNGGDEHDLTWGAGFDSGIAYGHLLISREGSSLRYKQDVQPLDEAFMKILDVSPKKYRMRQGYGPKDSWNFGYIAEELDKAGLKGLVIYDREGKPDGVKYKKVSLYVNEVVKKQQKQIDQLQAEMAELKKLVGELKK